MRMWIPVKTALEKNILKSGTHAWIGTSGHTMAMVLCLTEGKYVHFGMPERCFWKDLPEKFLIKTVDKESPPEIKEKG